jgi:hypothetical protein
MPRFLVMVKGSAETETGDKPTEEMLDAMTKYNEELAKAGVLLDLAGLQPTSEGARVQFTGGKVNVVDGPFTEAKELVAGYWLIDVKSKEQAIEWVKRVPFGEGGEIEIRQLYELEDFGESKAVERARALEKQIGQRK